MKRKLKDDNIIKICFAIAITLLLLVALIIISSAQDNYILSEQTGEKLYHLPNGVTDTDEFQNVSDLIMIDGNIKNAHIIETTGNYRLRTPVSNSVDTAIGNINATCYNTKYMFTLTFGAAAESANHIDPTFSIRLNYLYIYFPKTEIDTMQGDDLTKKILNYLTLYPISVMHQLETPIEKPNLQTRIAKYQSASIINGIANGIKNIALAMSRTITEFFYLSNEITTRGYIFITLLVSTMALSIIGLIIKR